jgi:hypothetical protein
VITLAYYFLLECLVFGDSFYSADVVLVVVRVSLLRALDHRDRAFFFFSFVCILMFSGILLVQMLSVIDIFVILIYFLSIKK